jgi:hypothetical protein
MNEDLSKRVYRSLVTLPRIFIGIQFAVILILVAIIVR